MDLVEKYVNKINALISEARSEGVDIFAYESYIGQEDNAKIVDSGIAVGINIMNTKDCKYISTWDTKKSVK